MAIFKATMLFQWKDTAGWTETFYRELATTGIFGSVQTTFLNNLAERRSLVLTDKARIVGVRFSDTALPRVTRLVRMNRVGQRTGLIDVSTPDIVNVAALATLTAASGARREYLMRGIIDEDVISGDFTARFSGPAVYNTWMNSFLIGSYFIRDVIPQAAKPLTSVSGNLGILNIPDNPFVVGETLLVRTRVSGNGKPVRWSGRVIQVNANNVTVKNWTYGDCLGGTVAKATVDFSPITQVGFSIPQRARTRQTGRPFDLLRGRQSRPR